MPTFAVLESPRRDLSASEQADRYVFLRERFNLGAFLFGPLWMIWRRLWAVLIIYLVVAGSAAFGLLSMGVGWTALVAIYTLIQLLVGLEATNLRRWTRIRRGWRDCGVVISDGLDMAERRFFDARGARRPIANPVAMSVPSPPTGTHMGPSSPDIVGLFPEPGGGR